jgi:S-adenosylmethionine hydrolase
MARIITLTTDFGIRDPYAGALKGAILSVNPDATIVDITHSIGPGNVIEGAFALLGAYQFFPKGTVHVAVVDPGVGGKRMPILIETSRFFFIGPDNGVLTLAASRDRIRRAVELKEERYFLKPVSHTFHGRDIFGPVAGHVSKGTGIRRFGPNITENAVKAIGLPRIQTKKTGLTGSVVHIDSFGNLITNITSDAVNWRFEEVIVSVKRASIKGIKDTYGVAPEGALVALIGGAGFLEIAVNKGSAKERLKADIGAIVSLRHGGA